MNIQPFKKSVCFTLTHNNVIPRTPYPFTQECSHVTTPTWKLQKTHSTLDFVLQFCCRLRCTYRGCQSATGSLQAQNFYFIFQYSRWPAAVFGELVSFEPHQKPVPRVQFWQPMSLYSAVESIFFSVPITSIQPSMSCFVSLRKMEAIVLDFEAPWCSESFLGFRTWMQVWAFIEREKQAQRERSRFGCLVFCQSHLRSKMLRALASTRTFKIVASTDGCVARRSTPFCCSSSSIFMNRRLWKVSK